MEIIGKLVAILPDETGNGKNGQWVKNSFIIETEEQFPKKIHFSLWGEEKVASIKYIPIGTQIRVHFSIESREFNERWYTQLSAFRFDTFNSVAAHPVSQTAQAAPVQQVQQPIDHTSSQQPPLQQPLNVRPATNAVPVQQQPEYGSFNTASTPEDDDLPF